MNELGQYTLYDDIPLQMYMHEFLFEKRIIIRRRRRRRLRPCGGQFSSN